MPWHRNTRTEKRNVSPATIKADNSKSNLMSRVRSKNTTPEMSVRAALHARGFRYRLHQKSLPGSPDLALPRYRLAVFVHGCFWHGCRDCDRGRRRPKSNTTFWETKLASNRARDAKNILALRQLGWRVAVIWECVVRDHMRLRNAIDELVATCESPTHEYDASRV